MAIFRKPFLKSSDRKTREMPEGLWTKCPSCGEVIHNLSLAENLRVCPKCDHHFTLAAHERIAGLVDPGSFQELDANLTAVDFLNFPKYTDSLKRYREKTGLKEAVITGKARICDHPVGLSVMDFSFLGASMGSVVGEKITRAIEVATKGRMAAIIISASGGARMHEGAISLVQMAKTSGALALHAQAGLPFLSILTHPTYGGVMASYASLGDVIIAEPKSMVGFAGPRVIKETTHQDLPEGFQTAEFLEKHGLVDMIVSRGKLRATVGQLLDYMMPKK